MEELLEHVVTELGQSPNWLRYGLAGWAGVLVLTGWRWHRFWFSGALTLAGGLWGLAQAERYHLSPMLVGVLAALATGCVALALTRLLVFIAGGWLCWQSVRLVSSDWANGLVCFLAGGILSTVLFRLVVRLVTAGVGVWLFAVALGWLRVHQELRVWQLVWPDLQGQDLAWFWLAGTVAAALVQGLFDAALDGWLDRRQRAKEKAAKDKDSAAKAA